MPYTNEMSETPTLTARLLTIIATLKRNIRAVGNVARVDSGLLDTLNARLNRLLHRFQRLMAQPPSAPQPTRTRPDSAQQSTPDAHPQPKTQIEAKIGAKIPGGKLWLLVLLPGQPIRESRAQFYDLILHPDMIALVAQTPQLARQILRPLCRFFSLPFPPYLQLPPRPKTPRKPRPYRARQPKPKPIKPPEPTFLEYLLAKYPPLDDAAPQPFNPNQIRKLFSR